jgi:hypothetical protein
MNEDHPSQALSPRPHKGVAAKEKKRATIESAMEKGGE